MNLAVPDLRMAPGARVVVNSLYNSKDTDFLTQDLLLVELPGRTFIDVSWFPEHDPAGAYSITVFRDRDRIAEAESKSAQEAVSIVERLAVVFSSAISNVSCSAGQLIQFQPAA